MLIEVKETEVKETEPSLAVLRAELLRVQAWLETENDAVTLGSLDLRRRALQDQIAALEFTESLAGLVAKRCELQADIERASSTARAAATVSDIGEALLLMRIRKAELAILNSRIAKQAQDETEALLSGSPAVAFWLVACLLQLPAATAFVLASDAVLNYVWFGVVAACFLVGSLWAYYEVYKSG
jgi:hypothetical protein